MSEAGRLAWVRVLDALEARALATGRETSAPAHSDVDNNDDGDAWVPPLNLGPLPADLTDRALEVLAAQRQAVERAQSLRDAAAGRLSALRTYPGVPRPERPAAFLDVTG